MSCQQKSVTNYLCLSLKGEFLNTLGGCVERIHRGWLWEGEGWCGGGHLLVSHLVFSFDLELFWRCWWEFSIGV